MPNTAKLFAALVFFQFLSAGSAFAATNSPATAGQSFSCLSPDQNTRFQIELASSSKRGLVDQDVNAQSVSVFHRDSQNIEHEVAHFDEPNGLLNNSDSLIVMYFESSAQSQDFSQVLGIEAMHSILVDLDDVTDSPLAGADRTVPAQVVYMLNSGTTLAQYFSCRAISR
jgi:hypothetical protein